MKMKALLGSTSLLLAMIAGGGVGAAGLVGPKKVHKRWFTRGLEPM